MQELDRSERVHMANQRLGFTPHSLEADACMLALDQALYCWSIVHVVDFRCG